MPKVHISSALVVKKMRPEKRIRKEAVPYNASEAPPTKRKEVDPPVTSIPATSAEVINAPSRKRSTKSTTPAPSTPTPVAAQKPKRQSLSKETTAAQLVRLKEQVGLLTAQVSDLTRVVDAPIEVEVEAPIGAPVESSPPPRKITRQEMKASCALPRAEPRSMSQVVVFDHGEAPFEAPVEARVEATVEAPAGHTKRPPRSRRRQHRQRRQHSLRRY